MSFGFIAPKDMIYLDFHSFDFKGDKGCSRNALCALNGIFTFLLKYSRYIVSVSFIIEGTYNIRINHIFPKYLINFINCLPVRSTWVQCRFLVGFVLVNLYFLCFVLLIIVCPFSFRHCIVCLSSIYCFRLPLWYLRFTASDFPFGILDLLLQIAPLVS